MKHLMSLLAVVLFSFAVAGCDAETVCDQFCDRIDVCSDTSNASTCKEGYANSMSANATVTTDACQAALDILDGENGCASEAS